MKYYKNEQWNDLKVKVSDTLPKGTEVDYNGTTVPDGWEQIEDVVTGDSLPYGSIVEYDGDAVPDGYEEVEDEYIKLIDRINTNYHDASGSNYQEMLRNKLTYAKTLFTKDIETIVLNGGWQNVNYGFALVSRIYNVYQIVWFSAIGIKFCVNIGNDYSYWEK